MKYKQEILKNRRDKKFTGTVQGSDKGYVFIIPDDETVGHDFFVPRHSVNGAFHGDKVLAAHTYGTRDEAYIIKILERGSEIIIGTFERDRNRACVYPDNSKQP